MESQMEEPSQPTPNGHTQQSFSISGCCNNPKIQQIEGAVYSESGWRIPYLLTACDNCGKIKSRSNFYDAEERI
jgi:hypothetical protein